MNFEIAPIFPTPIYKTNILRQFTEQEKDTFRSLSNKVMKNAGNYYSAQTGVVDIPALADIKDFITGHLNNYFSEIEKPKNNLTPYISTSWLTFTNKDEWHHRHNHPNSLISGVFYLSVDPNIDSITFHKEHYYGIHLGSAVQNEYNSSECTFMVAAGDLLLFPSYLMHSVKNAQGDHTRISLAFNVFVKGSVGNYEDLDGLTLN